MRRRIQIYTLLYEGKNILDSNVLLKRENINFGMTMSMFGDLANFQENIARCFIYNNVEFSYPVLRVMFTTNFKK